MENQTSNPKLEISNNAVENLNQTVKWSKKLSTIFIILTIIPLFLGFFMIYVSFFSETNTSLIIFGLISGIIYVLYASLLYKTNYHLKEFTRNIKSAIKFNNTEKLDLALKNQTSFYKLLFACTCLIFLLIFILNGIVRSNM